MSRELKSLKELCLTNIGLEKKYKTVNPKALRKEAKKWIKKVQNGKGIPTDKYPEKWKGDISEDLWENSKFSLGREYGFILALKYFFDIEEEDLDEQS